VFVVLCVCVQVDEAKIPDPDARKPEDWDESAPATIPDMDATKVSHLRTHTGAWRHTLRHVDRLGMHGPLVALMGVPGLARLGLWPGRGWPIMCCSNGSR
jgi:hypothetical protein